MIPLAEPNLIGNEARYLRECVETNFVSSVGPFVDRFESLVAEAAGTPQAVATASGTTALHVALAALKIERDDLVAMPSFTFIATANAASYVGAGPCFVDVEPTSWTLDPRALDGTISGDFERQANGLRHRQSGRRLGAILAVHTLGHPADMDRLGAVASAHGLPLVVDAACALGAMYKGRPAAGLGTIAALSFNGNKTVTCGGGGALVSTDAALLAAARHLATTARTSRNYDHDRIGFNYRMTNLEAAVGVAQMERLASLVAAKRRIAGRYDKAFAGHPWLQPFPRAPWGESACWYAGAVLAENSPVDLDTVIARLHDRGIGARRFWKPVHLQSPYADCPRTPLPITDSIWNRVLTLPCSTGLAPKDQETVIDAVLAILDAGRPLSHASLRSSPRPTGKGETPRSARG